MIEINNVHDGLLAGRADFHHGLLASDMWQLKLTRFEDVQPAFLALCQQLGV